MTPFSLPLARARMPAGARSCRAYRRLTFTPWVVSASSAAGSSGGGWLYGYNGNWGWLNGVNSRIDRILNPTIMLSPYFDNDAWDLYNFTRYN